MILSITISKLKLILVCYRYCIMLYCFACCPSPPANFGIQRRLKELGKTGILAFFPLWVSQRGVFTPLWDSKWPKNGHFGPPKRVGGYPPSPKLAIFFGNFDEYFLKNCYNNSIITIIWINNRLKLKDTLLESKIGCK